MSQGYDPRAVANLLLDEADRLSISVSNLALQKLLYFAHGICLIQTKSPLTSGYFEAWQYGPVHPVAYKAFKSAGSNPITWRATSQDILTGETRALTKINDARPIAVVQQVLNSYGRMSPRRLVNVSHAKNSPWDHVVTKARAEVAFGLRIPDDLIKDRFRYHIVSVGREPDAGDLSDDTPFT